jgi:HlyD family secretion protein
MKLRYLTYTGALVAVAVVIYFLASGVTGSSAVAYKLATVSRGNIETTVTATGSLSPVTTVEVGTQVSGTIDSVFVDYNDRVQRGQILAVLDTALLKATVLEAEANVEKARAQLDEAESDFKRNKALFESKLISEADFIPYRVALATQQAALKSADAALQRARRNLQYAVIRSPINGIVIGRNVEAGQTVAASLSTPTLFIIAEDLSRMEILADVDESDIGQIKVGQDVRFEVATYADKEFSGTVKQVRLQPQTVSNVVTYTVVVGASNDDGLLLPGMTATLDFITDQRKDVLLIPAGALRFRPSEKQLADFRKRRQSQMESASDRHAGLAADSTGVDGSRVRFARGTSGSSSQEGMSMVWYLDSLGHLAAAPVIAGLSNGSMTEVLRSRVLKEGMRVITGLDESGASGETGSQPRMGRGFRPPRGF